MNFQNLEYFLAVAKEKNITHAAESLGISQQALSNQIARLEQETGTPLFDRKHNFALTPSGKYFYESATRILDINRETETVLNDISESKRGELKIGISFSRGQAILPLILPEFHEKYPLVNLQVIEGSTRQLEEDLARGNIDVIIGYAPFKLESAVTTELVKEHIYLVVPKDKRYTDVINLYKEKKDLRVFSEYPFILLKGNDRIRTLVNAEFKSFGISPQIVLETENIQTAFSLASQGMGIAVCPELYLNSPYTITGDETSIVRNKVELLPFPDNRYSDIIAIGYDEDRYQGKIAKDFVSMTIQKFR